MTPCPITTCHCKKSLSSFPTGTPSATGRLLEGLPAAFSSPGWTAPTLSVFPHRRGVPALWSPSWTSSGPAPAAPCPSLCWGPQNSRWVLTRAEYRGRIPSLDLLATLLLMQPRIRLAFWAASTHCWVILSFLSTNTLKYFSLGLLSIPSSPSLYLCLGLPQPRCRTLHLALLNFGGITFQTKFLQLR